MAVFTAVQPVADTFFFWLPLYYEAKLALAVYLWANGEGRRQGRPGSARGSSGVHSGSPMALCCAEYRAFFGHVQYAGLQGPWSRQPFFIHILTTCAASAAQPTPCCLAVTPFACSSAVASSPPHPHNPRSPPTHTHLHTSHPYHPTPADLAGAQHVWARWFHPLVSRYEPVVDRRLGESKALAREWLHSHSMRLLALAQAKALAWLAQVQAQAQQAAGRMASSPGEVAAAASADAPAEAVGAAPRSSSRAASTAAKRSGRSVRRIVEEEYSEEEFEAEETENAADANAGKRAGGQAGGSGSGEKKAAAPAVPDEPLLAAFSSRFSLASFYSARSSDLQVGRMRWRAGCPCTFLLACGASSWYRQRACRLTGGCMLLLRATAYKPRSRPCPADAGLACRAQRVPDPR